MKYKIILTAVLSVSLLSCAREAPKVKHRAAVNAKKGNSKDISIVNAEDPICHMETAGFTKDTTIYKNKVYGFCSTYCKDEFKTNP